MLDTEYLDSQRWARYAGWALLGTIIIEIFAAIFISQGININMSADVAATAENMMDAELRLRAKAYIALLIFALEAVVSVGFFMLLRKFGPLLATWSLFISISASALVLLGAMFAINAAEFASDPTYTTMVNEAQRLMLASLQATSDYTSFHLGLIISAAANAGFFYLFIKSGLIPKLIAGWGLFASLFVGITIIVRDFVPVLGNNAITTAFMISNLVALVSTGLYLGIKGVHRR